jgi:ABC-type transport system involved in multi-copper enzyme maturation permease subunit
MWFPFIWAQAPVDAERLLPNWVQWLVVWGDPQWTDARWFGGAITWAKVLGLICLVCWWLSQLVDALRGPVTISSIRRKGGNLRLGAVAALGVLALVVSFVVVLEQQGRLTLPRFNTLSVTDLLTIGLGTLVLLLLEWALWTVAFQKSKKSGITLLLLVHGALAAGFGVVFLIIEHGRKTQQLTGGWTFGDGRRFLENSLIYGASYAGLMVLAWYAVRVFGEALRVRWRRLFSIAWHTVVESYRRMWAPWVVLAVFVLVLAFTNWFLGRSRTAELAPMFVSTLALLISLLLTVMVLFLAPISIPNDIRFQTIYTVVSKPVSRLELIWGRLIGYMAMVTVILLIMGSVSLFYIERIVNKRIESTQAAAKVAEQAGRTLEARRLGEDAYQLATRRSARVPLYGVLGFTDSRGRRTRQGIDVGQEQAARSHIEGATPSKATWAFGIVPDPNHPQLALDRRINVEELLRPGSVEAVEDRLLRIRFDQNTIKREVQSGRLKGNEIVRANDRIRALEKEAKEVEGEVKTLNDREVELARSLQVLQRSGDAAKAREKRKEIAALHSEPIPLEMTFNVFRTTKGEEVGEAVQASLVVTNPMRGDVVPARDLFPVHEYYTIRRVFPARLLVGCMGSLLIEVQCQSPNQFLGMAEKDLFILAKRGDFRWNYIRGLTGIWLQALVVTAIGLFASTFLSWPVALLLTLAFFLGGQVAIGLLDQFSQGQVAGGGPFISLIRLLAHENLQSDLDPTPAVMVAQAFDRFLTPLLSHLVYIVPNLTALDVSNTVASGFAVSGNTLWEHLLLGFGYAIPFTAAAFLILKNREVAA